MTTRVKIAEFGIINTNLANAVVTFYTTNADGSSTGTKATLYQASTGTASRENPQTLTSEGKLSADCYVESAVVGAVTNINERTTRSLKKIQQNPTEYLLPITSSNFSNQAAGDLYGDLAAVEAARDDAVAVLADAGFIAVSADLTGDDDIGTVADNISSVNTVAADLSGDDDVGAVAADIADVSTVAGSISSVNTAASGIANINTVAGIDSDVTAVAAIDSDVTAVAAIASDVSEVADEIAGALRWTYQDDTTMADPGAGNIRLNNATESSVTAIAIDDQTSQTGNPDLSDYVATWDDSTSSVKGNLKLTKTDDPTIFAIYAITALSEETGYTQLTVSYVDGAGSFTDEDDLFVSFFRTGNKGDTGAGSGDVSVSGTPLDNQVAVWTSSTEIEGTSGLTYDGSDLDITGNITVSGTVDGRDLATDGTKLDGIESGATADQTTEEIQDAAWSAVSGGTQTGITVTYQDGTNDVDFVLSDEYLQDVAGAMFSGNTETLITATYQDGDGTIDLVVDNDLSNYDNGTSGFLTEDSTDTLTNKTFDANGTGNSISNIDVADLANGTDGELITWDAAGAPATVGVGTSGQVLTSNGAGAAPTFQDPSATSAVTAGTTTVVVYSGEDIEYTTTSTSFITFCEVIMPIAGTVRVTWEHRDTNNVSGSERSQLYKNGVAEGAEQSETTATFASASLDVTVAVGDVIRLDWRFSGTGTAGIRNFQIQVDEDYVQAFPKHMSVSPP